MDNYTSTIEMAKMSATLIALIISIFSLLKSNRNTRRQVRISKLEEIIEHLQYFLIQYRQLNQIHKKQTLFKKDENNSSKEKLLELLNEYNLSVTNFKKMVDMDKFQEKTTRLRVLANIYLPDKELKLKVISLVALMTNLINSTIYQNYESSLNLFPQYPKPWDFMKYIEVVEIEILKEMNLGYKGVNLEKLQKYKDKFTKDLKI